VYKEGYHHNIAGKRLSLQFCVWKFPNSIMNPQTPYTDTVLPVLSVPQSEYCDYTLNKRRDCPCIAFWIYHLVSSHPLLKLFN